MKRLRIQIDSIDKKILELLAKRKALAFLVRKYKREHNMPVRIPAREKVVFTTRAGWGKKLGLSPTMVKKLMTVIIAESRKNQQ